MKRWIKSSHIRTSYINFNAITQSHDFNASIWRLTFVISLPVSQSFSLCERSMCTVEPRKHQCNDASLFTIHGSNAIVSLNFTLEGRWMDKKTDSSNSWRDQSSLSKYVYQKFYLLTDLAMAVKYWELNLLNRRKGHTDGRIDGRTDPLIEMRWHN